MKYALRAGLVLATTAASTALLSNPAHAHAAPFTVKAGSAPAGTTVAFTATSGPFSIKDTNSNLPFSCTSATLHGTVRVGATTAPTVGTVNGSGAVFGVCNAPGGDNFDATGYGTWNVNVADSTDGTSTGVLTNVRMHFKNRNFYACTFDVGSNAGSFVSSGTATVAPGAVRHTYTNSSQAAVVPPSDPGSLGMWNVRGVGNQTYCFSPSAYNQGDKLSLSINLKVTADNAAYNPISIT